MVKKIAFAFVLMFLSISVVSAKSIEFSYSQNSGDSRSSNSYYTRATKDGGFVTVSNYDKGDVPELNPPSTYSRVYVIVKYDGEGNIAWRYLIDHSKESINDLEVLNNGNIIFAYKAESRDLGGCITLYDAYVEEISKDGVFISNHKLNLSYESASIDYLSSDSEGNIYATIDYTTYTLKNSDDNYDYYDVKNISTLLKLDKNYNDLWHTVYAEKTWSYDAPKGSCASAGGIRRETGITIATNGDIVIASIRNSEQRLRAVRFDKSGNIIFNKYYGGENFSSIWAGDDLFLITSTKDNGVIVAGELDSKDYLTRYGSSDGYYAKIDEKGNVVWEKTTTNTGSNSFYGVRRLENGYVLFGYTSKELEELDGKKGYYLMVIAEDGTPLLYKSIEDKLYLYTEDTLASDGKRIYLGGIVKNNYEGFESLSSYSNIVLIGTFLYDIKVTESPYEIEIKETAYENEEVTFKIKLEEGKYLYSIGDIKFEKIDEETYKFIMPNDDVTLTLDIRDIEEIPSIDEITFPSESENIVENPTTGVYISYAVLTLVTIIALTLKKISNKNKKLYRI